VTRFRRRRQWQQRSIDVWLQRGDRPTDRRSDGLTARPGPASQRLEATRRRPARLILNIDHVYSTQRDSLVITISTTGQHGPLASSIVPGSGPVRHGGHLPVPSVRLVAVPPDQLVGGMRPAHIVSLRWLVCNFIKWVSLVRSSATTRRIR